MAQATSGRSPVAKAYALKGAAKFLDMSPQNLRRIVKQGDSGIVTELRGLEGVEGTESTVYLHDSLVAYKAKRDSGEIRTVRSSNGAKAYLVRMSPEQAISYVQWAEANNMPKLEARQQSSQSEEAKAKRKAYNAKRNAEKKAEREAAQTPEAAAAAKLAREQKVNAERAQRKAPTA